MFLPSTFIPGEFRDASALLKLAKVVSRKVFICRVRFLSFYFLAFNVGALNLFKGAVELLVVGLLIHGEAALFEADADEVTRRAEGVVEARQFSVVRHLPRRRRGEEGFELLQTHGER